MYVWPGGVRFLACEDMHEPAYRAFVRVSAVRHEQKGKKERKTARAFGIAVRVTVPPVA